MTTLHKPIAQHLLAQLDAFNWLMDVNPGKPRPPSAVEIAHARRAELAQIDAPTIRDIGMSAEDATGINSYQADLPFFMQSEFK